jgi:hypothetical protein
MKWSWRHLAGEQRANGLKRSEAIRNLIEFGLANTATAKAKRAKVKSRSTMQAPRSSAKKGGSE